MTYYELLAFYYFCKPMEDVKEFLNHVPMAHEPYDWYVTSFMHECKTVLLPKIKTYLINGEKDYVTPPFLLDYIPNIHLNNIERFVISNAGHFPWMEQLEKTCILIDKVIDK